MLILMTAGRSEKHIPEHSSVVEQLAYIQRVGGSIPSVPIAWLTCKVSYIFHNNSLKKRSWQQFRF